VSPSSDLVEVGYVARAHGVRGELRIATHNPESDVLADVERLWLAGVEYAVAGARPTQGAWLIRLDGLTDRDRAEALRGKPVAVAREDLDLGEGEGLLTDLIGCQVFLASGEPWGEVVAIEPGPQDRMVIHHGEVERLVPVVPELVVEVDTEAGRVVVDLPDDYPESPVES
jgi:16S rRNA processing protein RimM